MNLERSLTELRRRQARARAGLRIAQEQVAFQSEVVEDAKTRMLVAETPLADREFRLARDDLERLERHRVALEEEIAELVVEQDRLLDRMLGARA